MALSQPHPSGLRCGGKSGLSRPPLPCGGSHARVPHRRAAAGQGRAGFRRGCARNLPRRCAPLRLRSSAIPPKPRCWLLSSPQAPRSSASTNWRRRSTNEFPRSSALSWWSRAVPAKRVQHGAARLTHVRDGAQASLDYHAAGFDYRVDHGAFFQVNRWLVDALVERVTAGHKARWPGICLPASASSRASSRPTLSASSPSSRLLRQRQHWRRIFVAQAERPSRRKRWLSCARNRRRETSRSDRRRPAAHRPGRGDLRAARRDRRARPGLRLLRPRHAGPRPARARRFRLPNPIHHPRRPLSPDLSSGNSGPFAPRLIGLRARTAF